MPRILLSAVAVLVVATVCAAADTKPTPAEAVEIKQLSEDIFGLAIRKKACEKLGDYGPKAWSAIPDLTELLTAGKEPDADVLAAAATALGRIGGTVVTKTLTGLATDHKSERVQTAAASALERIGDAAATKALAGFVKHDAVEVRRIAVRAMAAADSRECAERLRAALTDDDPEVWATAALGLYGRATGEDKDGLMWTISDRLEKVKLARLPELIRFAAEQAQHCGPENRRRPPSMRRNDSSGTGKKNQK